MAAHNRRKGNRPTEREMNRPWRNLSPRSGSPASPLVNGSVYSPHTPRKRDSSASPVDQEYKKNVDFLRREWTKLETERTKKDTVTEYISRDLDEKDFQPFDLDAFLENLHQHRQQEQQQQ